MIQILLDSHKNDITPLGMLRNWQWFKTSFLTSLLHCWNIWLFHLQIIDNCWFNFLPVQTFGVWLKPPSRLTCDSSTELFVQLPFNLENKEIQRKHIKTVLNAFYTVFLSWVCSCIIIRLFYSTLDRKPKKCPRADIICVLTKAIMYFWIL